MSRFQKNGMLCLAAMLMIIMTACQDNSNKEFSPVASPDSSADISFTAPFEELPESSVITVDSAVEWETKEYEDTYLKYQIPAGWEENPDYSDIDKRFTFFISSEKTGDTPSNVNIQINSLKNQSKDMDYGDVKIQNEFHEFLLSEGGLPSEAKDGIFTVYQTPRSYVYAISFSRKADNGSEVRQTAYLPVGLDYGMMIWATDWNDGASPSADEIALHLCATLEIKSVPAK